MNIEKIEEKENPLLHRKEVTIKVKGYKQTPRRIELLEEIVAKLGYDKETTVIGKINQEYGKKEAKCDLEVYETKEHKDRYSEKYKSERTEKTQKEED